MINFWSIFFCSLKTDISGPNWYNLLRNINCIHFKDRRSSCTGHVTDATSHDSFKSHVTNQKVNCQHAKPAMWRFEQIRTILTTCCSSNCHFQISLSQGKFNRNKLSIQNSQLVSCVLSTNSKISLQLFARKLRKVSFLWNSRFFYFFCFIIFTLCLPLFTVQFFWV